jgi:hypothetical protein
MFKKRANVIADIYAAIEEIVFMSELNSVRASVTLLDDRYQHPRGQYRDILVLFKINGYACELQINIDEILIIKEGLGHKQYELIRKSLSILYCCGLVISVFDVGIILASILE